MDFKSHSIDELIKIRRGIDDELRARHARNEEETESAVRSAAQTWGYIADELIFGIMPEVRRAEGIRYQHPTDPRLTWDGNGARPDWVRDWLNAGRSLDDLRHG